MAHSNCVKDNKSDWRWPLDVKLYASHITTYIYIYSFINSIAMMLLLVFVL